MRISTSSLGAVLLVLGCRTPEQPSTTSSVAQVEPQPVAQGDSPEPEPEPEPTAAPERVEPPAPAPAEPEPAPPQPSWEPIPKPRWLQAERHSGNERGAHYRLESTEKSSASLRYQLDLRLRGDEHVDLKLSESDTGHALEHAWATSMCAYDFYEGGAAGAAIAEIAEDRRGRKLLQLWVTCQLGEDIRSYDSVMLLVLADVGGLTLVYSGETHEHSSHVCGRWSALEVAVEPPDLLIREFERGAIWEPESLPDYDCEDAEEFETPRGVQRLSLP